MQDRDLLTLIRKIVIQQTIWLRHYIGEVKNTTDPERLGRINVTVPVLGFNDEASGFWCYPRDKNALLTPKAGDWVEIYFMNGDMDRPVYLGKAPEIDKMLPKNYDGRPSTQIVFEDPENKIRIKFDAVRNELEIGSKDFRDTARKDDSVKSTGGEDSAYWAWLSGFIGVFSAWVPVPGDGGGALKTALTAFLGGNPTPTSLTGKITAGSAQVKTGDK